MIVDTIRFETNHCGLYVSGTHTRIVNGKLSLKMLTDCSERARGNLNVFRRTRKIRYSTKDIMRFKRFLV